MNEQASGHGLLFAPAYRAYLKPPARIHPRSSGYSLPGAQWAHRVLLHRPWAATSIHSRFLAPTAAETRVSRLPRPRSAAEGAWRCAGEHAVGGRLQTLGCVSSTRALDTHFLGSDAPSVATRGSPRDGVGQLHGISSRILSLKEAVRRIGRHAESAASDR
jgi:hypothetical protein